MCICAFSFVSLIRSTKDQFHQLFFKEPDLEFQLNVADWPPVSFPITPKNTQKEYETKEKEMTLTHLWNMGSTCVCCDPFGRGKDPQPACLYKQRVEKGADCPTQAQKGPKLGDTRQNGNGKRMGFTPCINQTSCCLLLSSSFKTQKCIFEEYKPERHQTQEYYVGLNASRTWGPHLLPESRLQKPGLYT